jgi:Dolichyl-phosphate-mannose-protein mannosyltransferase
LFLSSFPARIYLIALGLRLIPVMLTRQLGIGLDDMFQYDMLARSLASGNGFRWYAPADLARLAPYLHLDIAALTLDPRGMLTTFRAPLYPAFLAIIYYFNGINDGRFLAARLVQVVIGALLAPLTYYTARHIFPGNERAARAAGWVAAAYPMFLLFPIALATENLFFALVLVSILTLFQASESPANHRFLISGFFLGLAALTRSIILPFAILAIFWIWIELKERRGAVLTALMLGITIAPWMIRNSLISQKPAGIESSLGYNLYVGYHPQSTGTFVFGPSLDLLSILDDRTRDEIGTQLAIQFIQHDPARFPYLALRRLGYFFNLDLRAFTYFYVNNFLGPIPPPLLALILTVLAVPFALLCLSAAYGTLALSVRPVNILLGLLFIAYLLPHVFILSEERFHLVLIPYIAILAAGFWTKGAWLLKSGNRVVISVLSIVAVLLILNWGFELVGNWPVLSQMLGPGGNQLYLAY